MPAKVTVAARWFVNEMVRGNWLVLSVGALDAAKLMYREFMFECHTTWIGFIKLREDFNPACVFAKCEIFSSLQNGTVSDVLSKLFMFKYKAFPMEFNEINLFFYLRILLKRKAMCNDELRKF